MLDGVLENFTGAMLEPYLDGDGRPTDNRGIEHDRPRGARRATSRGSMRSGSSRTSTPSATGPCARRSTRSRRRGARTARSDTRPHIAHIQVIHPDDIAALPRARRAANAQPLWACHEAQMDELTIPFLGPERTAWQYPFASLLRGRRDAWRWAPTGPSRPPTRCSRWRSPSPGSATSTRGDATAVPARASGSTSIDALAGVHHRHRLRQPPRGRGRHDRGRQGRRTWSCSTATCSTGRRRDRRGAGRRHVHRRHRGPRGARARGLTPSAPAWTDDDVDSAPDVGVAPDRAGRCSCCATELIRGSGKETIQ